MHGCFEHFANSLNSPFRRRRPFSAGDRMVRRLPTNWRFQSSQSRGKGEADAGIIERGREDGGGRGGGVGDRGLRLRRRFRKNADEGKSM
jgi:hypothetical protein